jgi:YebC/PmpR family DNA-binding regulatory protein
MSGHSRWAGIKHKKAIIDAKRGKIFTRLIREVTIAAKQGGGKIENNPRLRKAVEDAKAANMPQDNIKRAIQKGTGELPGAEFVELSYEGYGPAGVAVFVEATTDNRNRTTSEIRHIFSAHGGNLGESGSVSWMFEKKGYIAIEKKGVDEEKLTTLAIDLGAEDIKSDDSDVFEVFTSPNDFQTVKDKLTENKMPITSAEINLIPKNTVTLDEDQARKCLELMDELDNHEDVKTASANFDIPQDIMEKVSS